MNKYRCFKIVTIVVILFSGGAALAACPSYDLSGDCKVNLDGFAMMASGWLTTYDANDLAGMASQWLDDGAFVTTWDTSLDNDEPGGTARRRLPLRWRVLWTLLSTGGMTPSPT